MAEIARVFVRGSFIPKVKQCKKSRLNALLLVLGYPPGTKVMSVGVRVAKLTKVVMVTGWSIVSAVVGVGAPTQSA